MSELVYLVKQDDISRDAYIEAPTPRPGDLIPITEWKKITLHFESDEQFKITFEGAEAILKSEKQIKSCHLMKVLFLFCKVFVFK